MLILKAFYFKECLQQEEFYKLEMKAHISSHTRKTILLVLSKNVICSIFHDI